MAVAETDYATLFHRQISRGVAYALDRIRQAGARVDDEDRTRAWHILSFGLRLPEAWTATRDLLLTLAPTMEQAGYREDWALYLAQGLTQSRAVGDGAAEADLHYHLGVLYQYLARFDTAREHLERSAAYYRAHGDVNGSARALNRLAFVARRQSRLDEAERLAREALDLAPSDAREWAYSHMVLGTAAYDRGAWPEAHRAFEQSLALWEHAGDERWTAFGLTNLGTAYWALERFEEAAACYERAIALFEAVGDPVQPAITRMNLGNVYLSTGRPGDAIELYGQAEPVFRRVRDRVHLASLYNNLGMAQQQLERWEEAEQAYGHSIELWRELGNVRALVNVQDNLGLLFHERKQYDRALLAFQTALDELARLEGEEMQVPLLAMVSAHMAETRAELDAPGAEPNP